jgi:hypothetical protein
LRDTALLLYFKPSYMYENYCVLFFCLFFNNSPRLLGLRDAASSASGDWSIMCSDPHPNASAVRETAATCFQTMGTNKVTRVREDNIEKA